MKRVLIIGATSAIATACARRWAGQGAALVLTGRRADRLEALAADLRVRGAAHTHTLALDVTHLEEQAGVCRAAVEALGGLDIALVAHGTLPDQRACEHDPALTAEAFSVNATSTVALLGLLANQMQAQGTGALAVISSVAGDRGRPGNYVYGSAKAAVSVYCEGLRARLFKAGVSLTDIRPGFVDTPMTAGLALPAALVAKPEAIAPRILGAIERGRDVVYVPAFWSLVMLLIRAIPPAVFKRLSL